MSLPFLNELATDWLAIGFIGGAVPMILLARFNYWCVRTAKRQAKAISEQAAVALWASQMAKERADSAMKSLDEMMHWAEIAQNLRMETAVDSLDLLARSARTWILGLLKGYESGDLTLLPRKFDDVMAFLIFQTPSLQDDIQLLQNRAAATENILKTFMEKPLTTRAAAPRIAISLGHQLEQLATAAEVLAVRIRSNGAQPLKKPAPPNEFASFVKQAIGDPEPAETMETQSLGGSELP